MRNRYIVVEVECAPGEESCLMTKISEEEFNLLNPLLLELKESQGWFHTGYFVETTEFSNIVDSYGDNPGWNILCKVLPKPAGGMKRILRVSMWNEKPMTLLM